MTEPRPREPWGCAMSQTLLELTRYSFIKRNASRSVRCNVTVVAIMRTEAAKECYTTLMSVECRTGVTKKRKLAIQSLRLLSDVIVVVAM